jgi:hypothetical protein
MSKYEYQVLDPAKSEIRVLRFVQPVSNEHPDLVHCTLVKVSLDDFLPEYEDFLLECRPSHPSHAKRWWLQADQSASPWLNAEVYRPRIAAWRYFVDMTKSRNRIQIMTADVTELPDPPYPTHVLRAVTPYDSLLAQPGIDEIRTDDKTPIPPRFSWGDYEALSYC